MTIAVTTETRFVGWHKVPVDVEGHRHVGRCRSCKRGATGVVFYMQHGPRLSVAPQKIQDEGVHVEDSFGIWVTCPTEGCGRKVVIERVKGHFVPDHKCNSLCLNAVGPSCDCSCGGANHGAGHQS